jgi:hypothetical protein
MKYTMKDYALIFFLALSMLLTGWVANEEIKVQQMFAFADEQTGAAE